MSIELLEKQPVTSEDDVSQYLREIREYPRLSQQEERELAMRCAEGRRCYPPDGQLQSPVGGQCCPGICRTGSAVAGFDSGRQYRPAGGGTEI